MSFTKKQLLYMLLTLGGGFTAAFAVVFFEEWEVISEFWFVIMFIVGVAMVISGFIFEHYKMRCSFCHRTYPTIGWWGMENCPYCGEPFD